MKTKYDHYLICQERGHVAEPLSTVNSIGTTYTCKFCGTKYSTRIPPPELIENEYSIPKPVDVEAYDDV